MIEDVRIAYGVAGPIPMRAVHAEETGRGKEVSARTLEEIAEQVLLISIQGTVGEPARHFGAYRKSFMSARSKRGDCQGRRCHP